LRILLSFPTRRSSDLGRSKVSIFFFGQAVVAERFDGIAGAHEGFQESDLERLSDREGVQPLQQFLDFGSLSQVSARHIMAKHFRSEERRVGKELLLCS